MWSRDEKVWSPEKNVEFKRKILPPYVAPFQNKARTDAKANFNYLVDVDRPQHITSLKSRKIELHKKLVQYWSKENYRQKIVLMMTTDFYEKFYKPTFCQCCCPCPCPCP